MKYRAATMVLAVWTQAACGEIGGTAGAPKQETTSAVTFDNSAAGAVEGAAAATPGPGGAVAGDPAVVATPDPPAPIVGGNDVASGEFPFFVWLTMATTESACGGALIDREWVLTAAHCVEGNTAFAIRVYYGDYALPIRNLNWTTPLAVHIHPNWDGDFIDGYDLALLRIVPIITAQPVAVGAPGEAGVWDPGSSATILGYGRTSASGPSRDILQKANTRILSDDDMENYYGILWGWIDWWNADRLIGAGSTSRTVCYGDSGGPLLVRRGTAWVVVGVASFTSDLDPCEVPGGFIDVGASSELAWVASFVPGVRDAWGSCRIVRGGLDLGGGTWSSTMTSAGSGSVFCKSAPGSSPPSEPKPPSQRLCEKKPWTPGCDVL